MVLGFKTEGLTRQVVGLAILFFVLTLAFSLHRYYTFYVTTDHAIFNQVFWNNSHGNWFQSSLSSVLSTNVVHDNQLPEVFYRRLGQHFTPALLLWVPIYTLFPSPITLFVIQVALIALAGLVLHRLALQHVKPAIATLIVASYYGANAVLGPALGNFYDLCQLPLFAFSLLLAVEKRQWLWVAVMALLILAIREDTGIVLFSIGLYLLVSRRVPRVGALLCIASVGYVVLATQVFMPLFSQDISRRFMIERFGQFVEQPEASTGEMLWAIATNPLLLLQEWLTPVSLTVRYLLGHWLPLVFIPAIAPSCWVMTLLPLTQIFLQQGEEPLSINIRYATAIIPGLFYGAILWWSQHPSWFKLRLKRFWVACIALSLVFTFTANPHRSWSFLIPDSIDPWVYVSLPQQWHHAAQLRSLLAQIPDDASVSASRYILAHTSGRRAVLPFARYSELAYVNDQGQSASIDYIVADLWFPLQYQSVFKDARAEISSTLKECSKALRNDYGLVAFVDGIVLAQYGAKTNFEARAAWLAFREQVQSQRQQPS